MSKNYRKDISYIGLLSEKVSVGIVGGGRAAYLKARYFSNNKCSVSIIAKEFTSDIIKLKEDNKEFINIIKEQFKSEFLYDKNLIIIAVGDKDIINTIHKYCDKNNKIYMDCSDFEDGVAITPVKVQTDNITACVNTKYGNPKASVILSKEIKSVLKKYDRFVEITSIIRDILKENKEYMDCIFDVIYDKDFKESIDENNEIVYLKQELDKKIPELLLEEIINSIGGINERDDYSHKKE